jgi:hypothetical protein
MQLKRPPSALHRAHGRKLCASVPHSPNDHSILWKTELISLTGNTG